MKQSEFEDIFPLWDLMHTTAASRSVQKFQVLSCDEGGRESGGAISLPISCFLITVQNAQNESWLLGHYESQAFMEVPFKLFGNHRLSTAGPLKYSTPWSLWIPITFYKYISSLIHFIKNKNKTDAGV